MIISLREATVADAEAIMRLHMRCHEEAYGRHLPPEFFDLRRQTLPGRIENLKKAMIAGHIPTVACDGQGLVGVATAGHSADPRAPKPLELRMIYILERVYGRGVGQLMLDAVIGSKAAFLWVLADNPRAHAFYVKNGFALDGATDFMDEAWHRLPIVRMVREGVDVSARP